VKSCKSDQGATTGATLSPCSLPPQLLVYQSPSCLYLMLRLGGHVRLARRSLVARPAITRKATTTAYESSTSSTVKNVVYGSLLLVGTGLFGVYYMDARGALHRYVITPAIRRLLDAETGHRLAVRVLASGLAPRDPIEDDASLHTEVHILDYIITLLNLTKKLRYGDKLCPTQSDLLQASTRMEKQSTASELLSLQP
jgi:hypothetical protein